MKTIKVDKTDFKVDNIKLEEGIVDSKMDSNDFKLDICP